MKGITQVLRYVLLSILLSQCSQSEYPPNVSAVQNLENGVLITFNEPTNGAQWLRVEILDEGVVHVLSSSNSKTQKSRPSLIVQETETFKGAWELTKKDSILNLATADLNVDISLTQGTIAFSDTEGKPLLAEAARSFSKIKDKDEDALEIKQSFGLSKDEGLYGLGQHQEGDMNYRGKKVLLAQENTVIANPFLISTKGYGLLWDNYSETEFNDTANETYLKSKVADEIDYYFMSGPTTDHIVAHFRQLTGKAPMVPKWALGYIQSRCRYPSFKELVAVAEKYRALQIPLDVMMISYRHWGKYGLGSLKFDEEFFPDPEENIAKLHAMNMHTMISTWPGFETKTENYRAMKDKDYLLGFQNYFKAEVYDSYNPGAGNLYWEMLDKNMFQKGIDGWWLDCSEPEYPKLFREADNYLGSGERYLNTYSLFAAKNIYEGQKKSDPTKRPFILTRSSFAGQQHYGAASWSGDVGNSLKDEVGSDFETLKAQIPAGLNFCLSGIPYWTTDIGGYKGGLPSNKEYQEVYTRWFQYGTFCPIFRTHGERYPGVVASPRNDNINGNELWSYGDKAMNICADFVRLRYRLMPYIYSLSAKVTFEGYTIMRGLPFDFSQDPKVFDITDQFMFGPSILVNPVVEAKANNREVYLPSQTKWYDFWTNQIHEGGQKVQMDAPIEKIPLLIKAGSILPFGPVVQYTAQAYDEPLEIRIYAGSDAKFALYEDEGNNHNYESGKYSLIDLHWDEASKKLTILDRKGEFKGMKQNREFRVVLIEMGETSPTEKVSHVAYIGEETSVEF